MFSVVVHVLASSFTPALRLPPVSSAPHLRAPAVHACAVNAEKLAALESWLSANGVDGLKATGGELPGYGQCLVAGTDGIKAGETVLEIPASLHITPSSVAESELGKAASSVVPPDDAEALLALGLLAEFGKGEAGASWAYINMLPDAEAMGSVPLLWTDDDRARLLGGSHLVDTVGAMREGLLAQWAALEANVLPNHPDSLFPREVFNAAGWLWANAVVLTRALPFGDEQALIPFLDLANHQSNAATACSIGVVGAEGVSMVVDAQQLEGGKEAVAVLTAAEDFAPGEQVFIDYGEAGWRSSWEMLYTYGFVPGEGIADWVRTGGRPLYFDGVSADDPLIEQKRAILVALGADEGAWEGTWLDLKADPDQCIAMAPLLRFAQLVPGGDYADADLKDLVEQIEGWGASPQEVWARMSRPLDTPTEAKVAARVRAQCEAALEALPAAETLAEAAKEDGAAEDPREMLAARVLLGERSALEACIAVWSAGGVDVADGASAK